MRVLVVLAIFALGVVSADAARKVEFCGKTITLPHKGECVMYGKYRICWR